MIVSGSSVWINTYGNEVLCLPPHLPSGKVDIRDIARSLSMTCRFAGHVREFYSVAQHSVLAALHAPERLSLVALLHDAAEAYIGDMVSGLKECPQMEWYRELELCILDSIFYKFGIEHILPLPAEIKRIDVRLLYGEMLFLGKPIENLPKCPGFPIKPARAWAPQEAEERFLEAFCPAFHSSQQNRGVLCPLCSS